MNIPVELLIPYGIAGALIVLIIGFWIGFAMAKADYNNDKKMMARDGFVYCKVGGEGKNTIYAWLTKSEFKRIILEDHGE